MRHFLVFLWILTSVAFVHCSGGQGDSRNSTRGTVETLSNDPSDEPINPGYISKPNQVSVSFPETGRVAILAPPGSIVSLVGSPKDLSVLIFNTSNSDLAKMSVIEQQLTLLGTKVGAITPNEDGSLDHVLDFNVQEPNFILAVTDNSDAVSVTMPNTNSAEKTTTAIAHTDDSNSINFNAFVPSSQAEPFHGFGEGFNAVVNAMIPSKDNSGDFYVAGDFTEYQDMFPGRIIRLNCFRIPRFHIYSWKPWL